MKDDKPAVKKVPRDVEDWAVPAPEPVEKATLPTGTHADNVKKNRRPGKP